MSSKKTTESLIDETHEKATTSFQRAFGSDAAAATTAASIMIPLDDEVKLDTLEVDNGNRVTTSTQKDSFAAKSGSTDDVNDSELGSKLVEVVSNCGSDGQNQDLTGGVLSRGNAAKKSSSSNAETVVTGE